MLAAERGRPGNAYFVTDGSPVVFREFVSTLLATQGVQAPEALAARSRRPRARRRRGGGLARCCRCPARRR